PELGFRDLIQDRHGPSLGEIVMRGGWCVTAARASFTRDAEVARAGNDSQARSSCRLPWPLTASRGRSGRNKAIGIRPLSQLLLEFLALVDDDLAVVGQGDLESLQRPGRRALEVDPGDIEAAAVARALELLLAGQPVGRAAQVRADRLDGVDDILA